MPPRRSLSSIPALRLFLGGFLLLLVVVARPAAAELAYGQGLLWRIQAPGIAPSHLFGTLHVTDERVLALPGPVKEAFETARLAVFEVIVTDEVRLQMAQAMVVTDGRTLDRVLDPGLYDRTAAAAAPYGFAPDHLRHFRPWALAMMLSVPQAELLRAAAGALPLDQALQAEAQRRGIPLEALETPAEQIALFAGLAEAEQVAILRAAVEENGDIAALFEEMTASYLACDTAAIHARMLEPSASLSPEFLELFRLRFNDERNAVMAERLAPLLRDGGAFIAVGALHLAGEGGLLRHLERQGFAVERLY